MNSEKSTGQSFLKGTLVLTSSIFIVKIFGILFRIFVTGMIGSTGAAYFQLAYEIYNPLFALATAGFPIAVSRMVSENAARNRFKDVRLIHKISIPIFLTTGTVGFILMIISSFIFPNLPSVNAPDAFYSILALAPTILFVCLMSIYRGYHQGLRNMVPTAVSELIEAVCKLFLGYGISFSVITLGFKEYKTHGTVFGKFYDSLSSATNAIMAFAAAGAIVGISIGALCGFIYLLIRHKKRGDGITKAELYSSPEAQTKSKLAKTLIRTAVPIGIGAIIMNIAGFIDITLILNRIQYIMNTYPYELLNCYKGAMSPEVLTNKTAHIFLLGCYSITLPLMMLVPAITQTFGVVSLPAVTRAYTKKDSNALKSSIESVIKLTTMVTIPAGLSISILGPFLLRIIYPHRVNDVSIASNIIPILGIATIFTATATPFCSMLQAVGRVDLPVKIISVGLIIKIIVNYSLVGIPQINIQGAGIGTTVGYAFILIVAMYFLFKETRIMPNLKNTLFKPFLASLICGAFLYLSVHFLINFLPTLISVALSSVIAVISYIATLGIMHLITREDLKSLPKGKKILKILEKCHIIK